jgi:hypothetical protein
MTTLAAALQAERVAVLYRRLVVLVGAQLPGSCLGQGLMGAVAAQEGAQIVAMILSLLVLLAALAITVGCAVTAYQLTREMGSSVAWLWAVGMLAPCVSVIVLLALSQVAQSWCRERGIKVGLLGPTKESIEELKRQSSVDRIFE